MLLCAWGFLDRILTPNNLLASDFLRVHNVVDLIKVLLFSGDVQQQRHCFKYDMFLFRIMSFRIMEIISLYKIISYHTFKYKYYVFIFHLSVCNNLILWNYLNLMFKFYTYGKCLFYRLHKIFSSITFDIYIKFLYTFIR